MNLQPAVYRTAVLPLSCASFRLSSLGPGRLHLGSKEEPAAIATSGIGSRFFLFAMLAPASIAYMALTYYLPLAGTDRKSLINGAPGGT